MAVGQYSDGFKGIWWIYYGFGIANNYYPIGGALSPSTFKGQTIQGIYSVEDNVGSRAFPAANLPQEKLP
ncbi:hypothetical protein GCM10011617_03580 [Novosphingobium arvoryzae]|uniref:Uncharacterized protein n=2 Tax=Novosphingobium arvoryzae TaxID=1256514 RepID=A0A918VB63_9SPHN|nr:hypothetical protein GCM10011617_03580 [Novosphingobium arvoryzae]